MLCGEHLDIAAVQCGAHELLWIAATLVPAQIMRLFVHK